MARLYHRNNLPTLLKPPHSPRRCYCLNHHDELEKQAKFERWRQVSLKTAAIFYSSAKIVSLSMFKKRFFIISLILIYWPLSIFFANTPKDFLNYLLPTLLILIAYLLYRRKNQYYLVPTLAIPFIQPKLAVLPLVFVIIDGIYSFKSKKKINKFVIIILQIKV